MNGWLLFWTADLLVAATAFAIITIIVTVRGYRDLIQLFRRLTQPDQQGREER